MNALPDVTLWDTAIDDHYHTWDKTNVAGREAMVGFLADGESVLDVGCGNGFVYRLAKGQGKRFARYVGVDLSQKFLEAAKSLSPELELYRADAAQLPFENNEFDTVFLMHVLDCTDGYEKPILEALRVAKHRVIVSFWHELTDKETHQISQKEPYGFNNLYSKKLFFEFIESLGLSPYPWVELHAAKDWYNNFFVLEKKELKGAIIKEATPEVQQAIDEGLPPLQTTAVEYTTPRRNIEEENLTWNPPVDNFEPGPELIRPGMAAPAVPHKKGLFSTTWRNGKLSTAIVDCDDVYEGNDPYDFLIQFKEKFPKFKITLFTVPTRSTQALYEKYKKLDWVELAVHGITHITNREFEHMDYTSMPMLLNIQAIADGTFSRVFKAPGWMISEEALTWCKDNAWTVMSHEMDNEKRPEGLRTLVYSDNPTPENHGAENIIHTHVGCCDNEIHTFLTEDLFDQETEFKFVSEVATTWKRS